MGACCCSLGYDYAFKIFFHLQPIPYAGVDGASIVPCQQACDMLAECRDWLQVPSTWRPVLEDPATLQLFLDFYATTKPPLSSMALECLVRIPWKLLQPTKPGLKAASSMLRSKMLSWKTSALTTAYKLLVCVCVAV